MNNRTIAKLAQLSTYIGKPCKYDHRLRYTSNGCCVECNRLSAKLQYARNPVPSESEKVRLKIYRATHKEENRLAQKRYRDLNKDKVAAYQKAYRLKNLDKYKDQYYITKKAQSDE